MQLYTCRCTSWEMKSEQPSYMYLLKPEYQL